jgi:YVTN family beta-propeller protein
MHGRRSLLPQVLSVVALIACAAPAAADGAAPRGAYVTNVDGASVSTFDVFTNVVGAPITLGSRPWGVAVAPDGSTAYVADENNDTVTPIDTATNAPGTPIPVGFGPRTIGIAPDGATAYVANFSDNTVTPIDTATNTPGAPIAVGISPHGIAIAPDGDTVYVTNVDSASITPIDTATNTPGTAIPVGGTPYAIAIAPDGSSLYASNLGGPTVIHVDTATATALAPIPVDDSSYAIAMSPDGETAYATTSSSNTVTPIDTATSTAGTPIAIPAGSFPEGLAVTPDGSTAYVTSIFADAVTPIDTATATTSTAMPVGNAPIAIAITPNQGPVAAFAASADASLTSSFDAAASSDRDGTIASYRWDFGDDRSVTTTGPTVSHSYARSGSYAVTLTVTDDEGCSSALLFTGQTASCNGSPIAKVAHAVTVGTPVTTTSPAAAQRIERFALDRHCVRVARGGRARIGIRLRLARAGSIAVAVDRAVDAKAKRCPRRKPGRRYVGQLRRVAAVDHVAPQAVAASVRRRFSRHFKLRPGLYRIAVRAYTADGGLTRPAYRWVRVLARR